MLRSPKGARRYNALIQLTWSEATADEFAHADHPEFPGFRVKAVYAEAIPRLKNALASAGETYYGQCTDEQLVTL